MSDDVHSGDGEEMRRSRYVDELLRILDAVDPRVQHAFRKVDRANFLDGFFIRQRGKWVWLSADRRSLSDEGASWIYSNRPLVTVVGLNGMPASSSSMPTLMMTMLDTLAAGAGMRVLEIGTGTGYNAALLSCIVGQRGRVVTIESDVELAAEAVRRLSAAGFGSVDVISGDGGDGSTIAAPYDKLIATAGCTVVPGAWWDQLAQGGRALIPLAHGATYPLTELRKGHTSGDWIGRYVGHASFMAATGASLGGNPAHLPTVRLAPGLPVAEDEVDCSPYGLDDLAFFLALDVPEARRVQLTGGDLGRKLVAGVGLDGPGGSAALVCGSRLYCGRGAEEASARLRRGIDHWHKLGQPDLRQYAVQLSGRCRPLAGPQGQNLLSWRSRRGSANQIVALLAEPPDDW